MVVKAIVAVKSTAKNVCIFHVISNSIFKNDINLISTTYSITSVTLIFDDVSRKAARLDGQQDGSPDVDQEAGVVALFQPVAERIAALQPAACLPLASGRPVPEPDRPLAFFAAKDCFAYFATCCGAHERQLPGTAEMAMQTWWPSS